MSVINPERWLYSSDQVSYKLSLAIWLQDSFTGFGGRIFANVLLQGQNIKPIRNTSGFYCFTDLAAEYYDVEINYKGNRRAQFFSSTRIADMAALPQPATTILRIDLLPLPSYSFPASATLIRGVLTHADGTAVADALVDAVVNIAPPAGISLRLVTPTKTTDDGQFVIALVLSGDDLASLDTVYPGGIPISITLSSGADSVNRNINAQESGTISLGAISF